MLKLDGFLRTDSPALTASGALGHIVAERSPIVPIGITQGRGRTIFHTGQTPVTVLVYPKVRHTILQRDLKKLAKPQVLKIQITKLKFKTNLKITMTQIPNLFEPLEIRIWILFVIC
jgi:hypothetical protein